ncbi:hypothetical protein GCM10018790_03490 [Kitasatospora xanthocidica]|nr:hypothetical protein GCM10018790_03490 [Kitasatospora xanthocidica]
MDRGDPGERLGRGAGLADHLDVVLDREQVVHTPSDDLVIIEQEYPDLSVVSHVQSLPYHRRKDLSLSTP